MSAPEAPALHTPKIPGRKRPITTSHNLTIFEPRLFTLMPDAVAKELINTMRSILTLGGRKPRLLDMRKQKIKDLLRKLANNEVIRVYNEFATAHARVEERLTFKLPLIEELKGGEEEVKENEEAHNDSDYHSAREELAEEEIATESSMQDEAEVDVVDDPDVEMEDVPLAILQISATNDVKTSSSTSTPEPQPPLLMPMGVACDKHTDVNCTVVPIQTPEAFPTMSIQEIQAEYYPFARVVDMCIHRDGSNNVIQATATMDKGPVDHLIINDPRTISFLGFRQPPYNKICLQPNPRIDETYQIQIQPSQVLRNLEAWIVGELVSARHAYLYWLDSRQTADPKIPPTVAEARILAPKIGRRAGDVWREIERCWGFEQGSGGRRFRKNRMKYLGENPTYGEGGERRSRRSMWV